ncbi:glycosyltransferase [Parabacteroides pacaensis]|uniref:glycosyltransferase n=1 Tax=Parabacteroides pacaensis TaxID=2086575 RepID=UPI000D0E8039
MDYSFFTNIENGEYIFRIIDSVFFLIFAISVCYLFIFAIMSTGKQKNNYPKASKQYKFAILFPAYKEDKVIINSVKSFFKQNYPQDKYDVFVISAEMEDHTNQQLKDLSAKVLVLENVYHTKTEALQRAINHIDSNKLIYDVVVVLDADNLVDPNFLEELNNAFYSGCSAVQTHRVAKNTNTSIAVLDAVSEEMNNSIFRKGHTRLGFSSGLIGSGMAFEYELFKNCILQAKHIGVDKQLEMLLLKQNVYIEYLSQVYTYDEKVKKSSQFYNQRRRWLSTQIQNLFWGITSLPKAILAGNWDYCNKLLQWMMPPRVILFGLLILIGIFLSLTNFYLSIKWWGLFCILCITFALAIPDSLVNKRLVRAIFYIPILFLLMFFNHFRLAKANKEFIHTEHDE